MEESIENTKTVPGNTGIDLGRWLGRREAFGLVAGRCSAAEVESLRRIREEKHYRLAARNWNEFCTRYLRVSRRSVDRAIGYLQEFGPAYFHISQLSHIGEREYRAIAAQVTEEGVNLDGNVVALLPENSQKVAEAISELLRRNEAKEPPPAGEMLDTVVKRCQNLARMLAAVPATLDANQKLRLGEALREIHKAAYCLGVIPH